MISRTCRLTENIHTPTGVWIFSQESEIEGYAGVAAGKMYFLSGVFYGAEGKVYLPMAKCLIRRIRRRRVDEFRNKFALGKLEQAAKLVAFFRHNTCSLQEMCGRRTAD